MSNSVLFQSFKLRDLTLRNRIVLAPMTRSRAGTARLPNSLMAEYYTQRSSAGLLISFEVAHFFVEGELGLTARGGPRHRFGE